MHLSIARAIAGLFLFAAAACQAQPGSSTEVGQEGATPTLLSTPTAAPTSTAIRTPHALPGIFSSRYLNPLDSPHMYVGDSCTYLRNKWDPGKAAPGTVVMIIMLQSINQGRPDASDGVNAVVFARMMEDLHEQRFHAINMTQLADFLEWNSRIPYRSVALIQDGRRYPENFEQNFRSYWESWGWQVINAWDAQGETTELIWAEYTALANEGLVDFQSYGPTFDPATKPRTDEYLTGQLRQPMEILEERVGSRPVGVVWPNGFSARSVELARDVGYRLGFTFNPRGPVMYNWVPQSDAVDRFRPSYHPEASVGDALMTLPRYWPIQVHNAIDAVRILGDEAALYAQQNKAVELEYYDIMCAAVHGPIPAE